MLTSKKIAHPFTGETAYPCPICRCGEISTLTLMEALACNSCDRIFIANVEKQVLKMADREPPMTWHWNGKNWIGAHLEGVELGWGYLIAAVALIVLPTTLIGFSAYYFPPTPGSKLSWLPFAWTWLAFLSHLGIVLWLMAEMYQFPVFVYLGVMRRRIFGS